MSYKPLVFMGWGDCIKKLAKSHREQISKYLKSQAKKNKKNGKKDHGCSSTLHWLEESQKKTQKKRS